MIKTSYLYSTSPWPRKRSLKSRSSIFFLFPGLTWVFAGEYVLVKVHHTGNWQLKFPKKKSSQSLILFTLIVGSHSQGSWRLKHPPCCANLWTRKWPLISPCFLPLPWSEFLQMNMCSPANNRVILVKSSQEQSTI